MCRGANLEGGLDVGLLARLTPGYVGSDLDSLMEAAASIADERQCAEAERLFGASPEAANSASKEGKKDAAAGALSLAPSAMPVASPPKVNLTMPPEEPREVTTAAMKPI